MTATGAPSGVFRIVPVESSRPVLKLTPGRKSARTRGGGGALGLGV